MNERAKPNRTKHFSLNEDEKKDFRRRHSQGDRLPNPHARGFYYFAIEALKHLGVNRAHPFKLFRSALRALMATDYTKNDGGESAWDRFCGRPTLDQAVASVDSHILANLEVLQRVRGLAPYGLRLLQIGKDVLGTRGCVINITGERGEILIELSTDSDTPFNSLRKGDSTATGRTLVD